MKTQQNFKKTALRLPPDLHATVHEEAKAAERSFNAEIIQRLKEAYRQGTSRPEKGGALLP